MINITFFDIVVILIVINTLSGILAKTIINQTFKYKPKYKKDNLIRKMSILGGIFWFISIPLLIIYYLSRLVKRVELVYLTSKGNRFHWFKKYIVGFYLLLLVVGVIIAGIHYIQ